VPSSAVSAEEFGLFEEVEVQAAACVEDFEADESASFQSKAMNPSTAGGVPAPVKVKKSWLYDAVENGALETIRLSKQFRFLPSALTRCLEERTSKENERE
jgi:hypothetical protein